MRLYPYVEIVDYVTLAAQLVYIVLTIVRLITFIYTMTKYRFTTGYAFEMLVELIRLLMTLGYVVFYTWRIDRTIYAVEALMNNKGNGILCDCSYDYFISLVFT